MQQSLATISWFFTGVRLFASLVPRFVFIAIEKMIKSTTDYWKNSQSIVNTVAEEYMHELPQKLTSDYDPYAYWFCYAMAAFVYLLGWLAMAWLSVEVFHLLISAIF